MDIVFEKMIMTLLLALWLWLFCSMYREWWKKNSANTAIAEADAREKRKWRYVRGQFGYRKLLYVKVVF